MKVERMRQAILENVKLDQAFAKVPPSMMTPLYGSAPSGPPFYAGPPHPNLGFRPTGMAAMPPASAHQPPLIPLSAGRGMMGRGGQGRGRGLLGMYTPGMYCINWISCQPNIWDQNTHFTYKILQYTHFCLTCTMLNGYDICLNTTNY